MDECPRCHEEFANELEVQQHFEMVHSDKWEGHKTFGQDGDENAVGAVPPTHPDQIATEGGRVRPEVDAAGKEDEPSGDTPEHKRAERRAEERFKELVEHPEDR